jgi:hypothetical protein
MAESSLSLKDKISKVLRSFAVSGRNLSTGTTDLTRHGSLILVLTDMSPCELKTGMVIMNLYSKFINKFVTNLPLSLLSFYKIQIEINLEHLRIRPKFV